MPESFRMDNPAGRLRHWIAQFDAYPHRDRAVSVVASEMLGYEGQTEESPDDFNAHVAFMRLGTSLADMCQEVRRETALLPDYLHPDMLLSDFAQVEAYVMGFTLARQTQVQHLSGPLDSAGRRGLEFLDKYLSTNRPQTWIDDDKRASLTEQVRDLIDQVMDEEDLDPDTKQFVIERLAEVETALRNARLTGTQAIERATDALIGSVRREPVMWQRIVEGGLGDLLSSLVLALIMALGQQPADNVLPPARPVIEINNTVVDIDVDQTVVPAEPDDVVDAEIIDGSSSAPEKESE